MQGDQVRPYTGVEWCMHVVQAVPKAHFSPQQIPSADWVLAMAVLRDSNVASPGLGLCTRMPARWCICC